MRWFTAVMPSCGLRCMVELLLLFYIISNIKAKALLRQVVGEESLNCLVCWVFFYKSDSCAPLFSKKWSSLHFLLLDYVRFPSLFSVSIFSLFNSQAPDWKYMIK